jgi:hypothetical protein
LKAPAREGEANTSQAGHPDSPSQPKEGFYLWFESENPLRQTEYPAISGRLYVSVERRRESGGYRKLRSPQKPQIFSS